MATFLRLVHDRPDSNGPDSLTRYEPVQASLLADAVATAFVCTIEELDERGFVELFTNLHATLALDLRLTPRFDFGTMNRRRALSLFEGLSIRYLDLGLKSPTMEACLAALDTVGDAHLSTAKSSQPNIVVFADAEPDYRELGRAVGRHLQSKTGSDWEVVLRGPAEPTKPSRRVIFISHANPEDNAFVVWLQAQLQRLGYEVWSDLSRLRAGEVFWDSIETAIRRDAVRVVVVVSEASMRKDGVLDEIALAVSVERSEKISGFVIPIKIDSTPYASLRANIARKNTLDFSGGWGRGLTALVGTLRRDGIQRGGSRLDEMLQLLKPDSTSTVLRSTPELLTSNRLSVVSIPGKLFALAGKPIFGAPIGEDSDSRLLPLTPHRGGWISFYSAAELRALGIEGLQAQSAVATDELRAGNVSLSAGLRLGERERLFTRIINSHLNFALLSRGLIPLAGSLPPTLYVPSQLIEKDQVSFIDTDGRVHRRILVGRSERRQLFWHLGMTTKYISGAHCVQIRLRVVFTVDGSKSTVSVDRMKDARRSFCKNWWNDRWRSLELALTAWLADSSDEIQIHSGDAGRLVLSAKPQQYSVPVSIDESKLTSGGDIDIDDGIAPFLADDLDDLDDEDTDNQ
jgi:hypothetical protein